MGKGEVIAVLGVISTILGLIAASPFILQAIPAFVQHLQDPTGETLVSAIWYIILSLVAFAVPTTPLGIFLAASS
jgi:hypothetical protein